MSMQTWDVRPATPSNRPAPRIQRLTIRNLTKHFGDLYALRNFNLDVEGGEFISLLGPSGCGKTTALNCLAGLIQSDGGEILLEGQDISRTPPERRHFGMVFQNYALFPHLTVARNVAFGLEMAGVPSAEIVSRVEHVLTLVQLREHQHKYPAQLSGGQQQRVALARAIVTEPRLMLMDEPLSNLDAKLRLEMRTEIRRLHQALGLTTIYVTHDQEEALSLSDRIVLMRNGVVQQTGTPRGVYDEPDNVYVANFLGYRNLFPMQVSAVSQDRAVVRADAGIELAGTPRTAVSVGDRVIAAIRAEDIVVRHPQDECANGVPGLVEMVEFLGRDSELNVQSRLGPAVIVRTTEVWQPESSVLLHFPAERLLIFPEEVG